MPYQIFISYRRMGSEFLGKILYDRLTAAGYRVFYDVESLRSGQFNTQLYDRIDECTDFILLLPQNALDRCISDPNDWVLFEVSRAIQMNKNIIPIKMRGFEGFPKDLPASIASLPAYECLDASVQEYFDAAFDRLTTHFLRSKPSASSDSFPVTTSCRMTDTIKTVTSYVRKHNIDINDFISFYNDAGESADIMKFFPDWAQTLRSVLPAYGHSEADISASIEKMRDLTAWISGLPAGSRQEIHDFCQEVKSLNYVMDKNFQLYRIRQPLHFTDSSATWDVIDIFEYGSAKWIIASAPAHSLLPMIGVFQVVGNSAVRINPGSQDYLAVLMYYTGYIRLMDVFPEYVKEMLGSYNLAKTRESMAASGSEWMLDNNDFHKTSITGNYVRKGFFSSTTSRVCINTRKCYTVDQKTLADNNDTPFGKEQALDLTAFRDSWDNDQYYVLTCPPVAKGDKYYKNEPHVYTVYSDPNTRNINFTKLNVQNNNSGLSGVLERFALRLESYRTIGIL